MNQFHIAIALAVAAILSASAHAADKSGVEQLMIAKEPVQIRQNHGRTLEATRGALLLKQSSDFDGDFLVVVRSIDLTDPKAANDECVFGWVSKEGAIYPYAAVEEFGSDIAESPTDVVSLIETGIVPSKTNVRSLIGRGNAYSVLHRFDKAILDLRRAVDLEPENPVVLVKYSEALCALGRFYEAIAMSSNAVDLAPELVPAYLARARARAGIKRYQQAIDDCTTAINLNPKGHGAYCCRGYLRCLAGELKIAMDDAQLWYRAMTEARAAVLPIVSIPSGIEPPPQWHIATEKASVVVDSDLEHMFDILPDSGEKMMLAGIYAQRHLGNDRKAIELLDNAQLLKPPLQAQLRIFYHRGRAKAWIRRSDAAIKDFARAAELLTAHPELATTALTVKTMEAEQATCRADAREGRGRIELAQIEVDEAIRLDPELVYAYLRRASLRFKKNELDNALVDVQKVLERNDVELKCRAYGLGMRSYIELRRGQHADAETDATEAIQLYSRNEQFWLIRAQSRLELGKPDGAISDCDQAIEMDPDLAIAYCLRGDALRQQKHYDDCLKDYDKAISIEPRSLAVLYHRGDTYSTIGKAAEAIADFEQILTIDPNEALTRDTIAWIQATSTDAAVRNGASAITNAKKACELTEWKNDSYLVTLAAAYAEIGEFDEAKKFLNEAIAMAPEKAVKVRNKMMESFEEREPYRQKSPPVD